MSQAEDYRLVEQAIRFLEANFRSQPSLAEVAAAAGLSEYHFQRLFKRWAGISPKRFLQFLTLEYAKSLLRESRPLLEASYDAGLSGPGRLHDLFVTLEAVTPGQYRRNGEGVRIAHGRHDTPFGECLLAATDRGICALYFLQSPDTEGALSELHQYWPEAILEENRAVTGPFVERIFADNGTDGEPIPLHVRGTNFQVQVWRALLRIPSGRVASYEDVAGMIGKPRAARAAGQAVGSNPIGYAIPCHRVIRKSGAFGNYGGGTARKLAMLGWEAAHLAPGE